MDPFLYNTKHSLNDMGVYTKVISANIFPPLKTVYEDLPGTDGEIDISRNNIRSRLCLKPRLIEVECNFSSEENPTPEGYSEKLKSIRDWLFANRDNALKFDADDSFYYMCTPLTPINVEKVTEYSGRFTVVFKCHPFKYSIYTRSFTADSNGRVDIQNNGYYTGALFVFSGEFTDQIAFNYKGKRFQINTSSIKGKSITIDTERMTVTRGGVSILHLCEGDFFEIEPGESYMTTEFDGDISTLKLNVYFTEVYL